MNWHIVASTGTPPRAAVPFRSTDSKCSTCSASTPRPPIRRTAGPDSQPSCGPCPGPGRTRTDQAAEDRRLTGTGPRGRTRQVRARTITRPWDHRTWPAVRLTTDGSGLRGRPGAGRSGEAGITAGVAQRRSHGLQRGLERPGAHNQRRAGRVCRRWVNQPSVGRVGLPARTASGPATAVHRGSRQGGRRQVVRPMSPASAAGGTGRARLPGPAATGHRAGEGLQFPPPRSAPHTPQRSVDCGPPTQRQLTR
jgi:hypothetical protein